MNNYDFWSQQRGGQSAWQNNPASSPSTVSPRAGIPGDNYKGLAGDINQFMTGQAIAPYLANLPNYANNVGQFSQNTTSQLKGQLPQDVITQIGQAAAERGIANGLGGGGNNNAAYLRALGLNSNQMMQQGAANLHQGIADTPVPQLFNPASLIGPQINANLALGQAQAGQRSGAGGGGGGYTIAGGGLSANWNQGIDRSNMGGGGIIGSNLGYREGAPAYNPNAANDWWNSYGAPQQPQEDFNWDSYSDVPTPQVDTSWEDAAFW